MTSNNHSRIFKNAKTGTLLIELSTIYPTTTDIIHFEAKKLGLRALDAPIGRLAWHAQRGESLFMVGGARSDFDKAMPLLKKSIDYYEQFSAKKFWPDWGYEEAQKIYKQGLNKLENKK